MPWQPEARRQLIGALLPGVDQGGAQALLDAMERVELEAGATVVAQDEHHGRGLWFVQSGSLSVLVAGVDEPVATIRPAHWVGEVSMLDSGPPSATVVTAEPSVLLRLEASAMERLRTTRPDVVVALLDTLNRALVARIRATDQYLHELLEAAEDEEPSWWESATRRLFGRGGEA
jgi:CRP-like cAMP-binding protein